MSDSTDIRWDYRSISQETLEGRSVGLASLHVKELRKDKDDLLICSVTGRSLNSKGRYQEAWTRLIIRLGRGARLPICIFRSAYLLPQIAQCWFQSVGIYRTAPGRHSRACRTFPVSVITSVTVVVSYEAGTRVTPLDITFIHSFSLEDRHKL